MVAFGRVDRFGNVGVFVFGGQCVCVCLAGFGGELGLYVLMLGVCVCVWVGFVRGQCVVGFGGLVFVFGGVSVFVVRFEGGCCVRLGLGFSSFFSSEKGFISVAFLHTPMLLS